MSDPAVADDESTKIKRLARRLARRDKKIVGMRRRIEELERELGRTKAEIRLVPRDITRAVQEALCNVRMIPVLGIGSVDRIIEVRTEPKGDKRE